MFLTSNPNPESGVLWCQWQPHSLSWPSHSHICWFYNHYQHSHHHHCSSFHPVWCCWSAHCHHSAPNISDLHQPSLCGAVTARPQTNCWPLWLPAIHALQLHSGPASPSRGTSTGSWVRTSAFFAVELAPLCPREVCTAAAKAWDEDSGSCGICGTAQS